MVFLLKEAKIKSWGRQIKCTKKSLFYCPVNGGEVHFLEKFFFSLYIKEKILFCPGGKNALL